MVSAITITVIAKLNLRCMAGRIVVVIAMRAHRRGSAQIVSNDPICSGIEQAGLFPDRYSRSSYILTNSPKQSFRAHVREFQQNLSDR
jgi:hypothetical protein